MKKIYAQVYSLLKQSRTGVLEALRTLSEIGYDGVEPIGIVTEGLSFEEYKKYLHSLKLDVISYHAIKTEEEYKQAAELGARFAYFQVPEDLSSADGVKRLADAINEQGKYLRQFGLRGVYHNHAAEFRKIPGGGDTLIYDYLLQNTDPECGFEFDVGWAVLGGADPVEYVRKYPGKFPVLHVKECGRIAQNDGEMDHFPRWILEMKREPEDVVSRESALFTQRQADAMYETRSWNVELGKGLIDWPALREACEAQGIQGYINEREYYHVYGANGDMAECARKDFEFLDKLL